MKTKRQEQQEVLGFLKESFGFIEQTNSSNRIILKDETVENKCIKFKHEVYLFSNVIFPQKYNIIELTGGEESFLKERRYRLKINNSVYCIKFFYYAKTVFDELAMKSISNKNSEIDNLEHLLSFLIVPKKISVSNENNDLIFESKVKVKIPISKIMHTITLMLNQEDEEVIDGLYEKIHFLKDSIAKLNQTSIVNGIPEYIDNIALKEILSLPKGNFVYKNFKVAIKTKEKNYLLKEGNIAIKIKYNIKQFCFTDKTGKKVYFKKYTKNLF